MNDEQRCRGCRHWKTSHIAEAFAVRGPDGWRVCARTEGDYEPLTGKATPQPGSLATAGGLDSTWLGLFTAPTFGCVMWETDGITER